MKTVIEVLFGVVFFPIFAVIGLFKGTVFMYQTYHRGFRERVG